MLTQTVLINDIAESLHVQNKSNERDIALQSLHQWDPWYGHPKHIKTKTFLRDKSSNRPMMC